jgi:septal ring factor EnvC (AmiA/AmiB activator)
MVVLATSLGVTAPAVLAEQPGSAPAASSSAIVQAQIRAVDAKVATARDRNTALSAQVARLEQHNAKRKAQLQQRDAEIGELRRKLAAAGMPSSAVSAASATSTATGG